MADLTKSLGSFRLIALGAAGVIGSSWIYTNGEFFDAYGAGGEIFGLAIAAAFAACVAAAYGELASTLPRAGGEVVYAYAAFNRPTAFAAGWLLVASAWPGLWACCACTACRAASRASSSRTVRVRAGRLRSAPPSLCW